ncbi:MAG: glycosyltransferase [Bdellovibrionota bacterium]
MKILFTGSYEPDYNRNKILIAGLKKLGHEVIEYPFKKKSQADRGLLKLRVSEADFVYLPSFTHREVGLVKGYTKAAGKKLIFDPLVSRYLTKVHDYKLVSAFGLSAWRNFYRDKWSLAAADFVVTDTKAHLEYFHQTFKVPREKMAPLYIGNNFDEYFPAARMEAEQAPVTSGDSKVFKVGFYGGFIPLQGVGRILEAAKLLRDHTEIEFEMVGSGFEFEKAKEFVRNHGLVRISMPGWAKQTELPGYINGFDLALGIFGETAKADLVIPNKIYHYAACAKPILTKDNEALREVFTPGRDIITIGTSPQEIADAVLKLKANSSLRLQVGQAAYKLIQDQFNEVKVAEKLISYFKAL